MWQREHKKIAIKSRNTILLLKWEASPWRAKNARRNFLLSLRCFSARLSLPRDATSRTQRKFFSPHSNLKEKSCWQHTARTSRTAAEVNQLLGNENHLKFHLMRKSNLAWSKGSSKFVEISIDCGVRWLSGDGRNFSRLKHLLQHTQSPANFFCLLVGGNK